MLSKDDASSAALAAIPGPDGATPLDKSGAIDGVTIRDGKVFLAIKVDPARANGMEGALRASVEARIKALPGVASALVTLDRGSAGRARRDPAPRRRMRIVPRRAAAGRSRA